MNAEAVAANNQINKTWSQTFPCNKSAQGVMSAVQNDMGQFADNSGPFFGANFPNQPITMGGQYSIQPGVMNNTANMFGSTSGGMLPVANLVVTVTSESANQEGRRPAPPELTELGGPLTRSGVVSKSTY